MELVRIYLVGPVRNNQLAEDVQWRHEFIEEMTEYPVRFLNPLAGKTIRDGQWESGIIPNSKNIAIESFDMLERADMVVANFSAIQTYPCIGSLIEFGRASAKSKLMYTIVPKTFHGGGDGIGFYHPLIDYPSAFIFNDVSSCLEYVKDKVLHITGTEPRFTGKWEKGAKVL